LCPRVGARVLEASPFYPDKDSGDIAGNDEGSITEHVRTCRDPRGHAELRTSLSVGEWPRDCVAPSLPRQGSLVGDDAGGQGMRDDEGTSTHRR